MKKLLPIALVAAALIAGCGKPEDKFVGKWNGKVELPQAAIDMIKAFTPEAERGKVEQDIKDTKIELDLKKDRTYTITTTASGKTDSQNGTWTLDKEGKTVTLSAPKLSEDAKSKAKAAGATDAMIQEGEGKSMAYTVSTDKRTLTHTEEQMGMSITMTFSKA